ncbi:MAG: hypothetical protein PWR25_337 [Euryarchaeota archaeon]|jgi:hypothetical protein|nr:hypothetical protein [Euryarchaeota archaeon]
MIRYGNTSEDGGRRLLRGSGLCAARGDALYYRPPYSRAMDLTHGPQWWRDPGLWPPPAEYYEPGWWERQR